MSKFKTKKINHKQYQEEFENDSRSISRIEPKMSFRWRVIFPEEFHIPAYVVHKCQLPKYKECIWQSN